MGNLDDYREFEKLYAAKHPEVELIEENQIRQDEEKVIISEVSVPIVKPAPVDPKRKEWLNKLHIFQRYRFFIISSQ